VGLKISPFETRVLINSLRTLGTELNQLSSQVLSHTVDRAESDFDEVIDVSYFCYLLFPNYVQRFACRGIWKPVTN
jgi:hypothetical protein